MSVKQLVTAEELWQMPDPPGKRLELVDGKVVEVSPATMLHGVIVATLTRLIDEYVHQHDLGIVAAGDVGFVLRRDPDLVRPPMSRSSHGRTFRNRASLTEGSGRDHRHLPSRSYHRTIG